MASVRLVPECLLALAVVPHIVAAQGTDTRVRDSLARDAVAAQAEIELVRLGLGDSQPMNGAGVDLALDTVLADGTQVLRGRVPSVTSSREYLMGWNGQLIRLGGFHGPDAIRIARALGPTDLDNATRNARILTSLLDPFGGRTVLHFADSTHDEATRMVSEAWCRPAPWPRERIGRMGDGTLLVVTTTFTIMPNSPAPLWRPVSWVLLFAERGDLLAWNMQMGESIGLRGNC